MNHIYHVDGREADPRAALGCLASDSWTDDEFRRALGSAEEEAVAASEYLEGLSGLLLDGCGGRETRLVTAGCVRGAHEAVHGLELLLEAANAFIEREMNE